MGWFDNSFLNPINDVRQVGNVAGPTPGIFGGGMLGFSTILNAFKPKPDDPDQAAAPAPPSPQAIEVNALKDQLTYEDHLRQATTLFAGGLGGGGSEQTPTAGTTLLGSV